MEEVNNARTDRLHERLGSEVMTTDKPHPGTEVIMEVTQAGNQAYNAKMMQLQFICLH